ncbi:MAG: YceI family protein [Sphingobacteriaceae bacterium]|nr:YceI family protein [Sphingobacteriaceae bacterium]
MPLRHTFFVKLLLLALVLVTSASSNGLQRYTYRAHQMTIEGRSNWQAWRLEVKEIGIQADLSINNKGFISLVGPVVLMAKAAHISAPRPSLMDRNVGPVLKADKHPYITFNLTQIDTRDLQHGVTLLKTKGLLSMAGVGKEIEMEVFARVLPNADVEIWGMKDLDMRDFDISPPTAFFGIIRSEGRVKINFDIILRAVPRQ